MNILRRALSLVATQFTESAKTFRLGQAHILRM